MEDVYLAEVDFSDVNNIFIRAVGDEGVKELTFLEFLQNKGEYYFRDLSHYKNWFKREIRNNKMKLKAGNKKRKFEKDEFQIFETSSTKTGARSTIWIKFNEIKCLNYALHDKKNCLRMDLEELYKLFIKRGMRGTTASSAFLTALKEDIGEGRFRNSFNDARMANDSRFITNWPLLDASYQGEKGKIGAAKRGAINLGMEETPFEYEGVSTTIDMVSQHIAVVTSYPMPHSRPRIISWESYKADDRLQYDTSKLHLFTFRVKATAIHLNWLSVKGQYGDLIYNKEIDGVIELYQPEFERFLKHYKIHSFEMIEILQFDTVMGRFDKMLEWFDAKYSGDSYFKLGANGALGKISSDPRSNVKWWCPEGKTVVEKSLDHSRTYMALFGAILAYARCSLVDTIERLGWNNFIYSDTDSITFKGELPKDFETGDILGKWKVESHNTYFRYIRRKVYMKTTEKGDVFKTSGISKEGKKNLTKETFLPNTIVTDYAWDLRGIVPKLVEKRLPLGGKDYEYREEDYYEEAERRYTQVLKEFGSEVAEEWRTKYCPHLTFDISDIS